MSNKPKLNFLLILFTLLLSSIVIAEVQSDDKIEIQNQITMITDSVNNNDVNSILDIISPNARIELKNEISKEFSGRTVKFEQSISSYEDLGANQIKVKGKYSASGPEWHINGMSNYYIFEKSEDS